MKYFLAGAEVPSHRKIMNEVGAQHVALSYVGLSRRIKFTKPWMIGEKFAEGTKIFLDSGAHSINSATDKFSFGQIEDMQEHYHEFVEENLGSLALVSEFDALPLGFEAIEQERKEFWDTIPAEQFLPIWHSEQGLGELNRLAEKYPNVGITATSLSGRNLEPTLNQIASQGTHLHAVGLTSVDEMYAIKWGSVSSTSWISPQQYGDTIVWTGKQLKRYPKSRKDQARKRYRTLFENEGFDSAKIEADDHSELLRLSIWSWERLMEDIDRKHSTEHVASVHHLSVVTNPTDDTDSWFAEKPGEVVDNLPLEVRNRETTALPVLGVTKTIEKVTNEDGEEEEIEHSSFGIRSESTRVCKSCFLASKCPAFDASSNCAYNIPVEIKTRDQFTQMQNSLIEMQAQRVLFMRFAEEQEGGYADPNLSGEIDRLQKLLKTKHEMEQEGFSFKVEAKATGGAGQTGMLARLFGEQASQAARALPQPVSADQVIIDAEIVQEWTDV